MLLKKSVRLFLVLCCVFVANAILAEFLGVKIFSLERTLGIQPIGINFGSSTYNFDLTAGVLLWPIVFITTDIINDYFGKKAVRFISFLTSIILVISFLLVNLVLKTEPSTFWVKNATGVTNINESFKAVFSQGMWIIIGSIMAFLVGQLIDALVFEKLKRKFKSKHIWLRATVSTLISQFIDSYLVLFIAFYIGSGFKLSWVMHIGSVNYLYKFVMALLLIPLLYGVHFIIIKYLGKSEAESLRNTALNIEN